MLGELGLVAWSQDDHARAAVQFEESLALSRELGDPESIAHALHRLGRVARQQGDYVRAAALLDERLAMFRQLGDQGGIAYALWEAAIFAVVRGYWQQAAQLFGTAEALSGALNLALSPVDRAEYERDKAAVETALGSAAFTAAWEEGRGMTPEQAIATLDHVHFPPPERAEATSPTLSTTASADAAGLTEREVAVLRLLAQGLTYAQIAEQLIISPRTVNRHLTSIYGKLDVTSRHAATRFAIDHHLI